MAQVSGCVISVALSVEMLGDEFAERSGFVKVLVASDLRWCESSESVDGAGNIAWVWSFARGWC